ncbi:hypothetical protein FACS189459_0710 [Bacilli bacterium]|nr:hypothetical protein FACS189459_0710 [Bacilli bacterium]
MLSGFLGIISCISTPLILAVLNALIKATLGIKYGVIILILFSADRIASVNNE